MSEKGNEKDNKAKAEENTDKTNNKAKGGKLKTVIIILLALVLVIGVSVGATLMLMSNPKDATGVAQNEASETSSDKEASAPEVEEKSTPERQAKAPVKHVDLKVIPARYYPIRPVITVVLQSDNQPKYLQIGVDVMTRKDGIVEEIQSHLPRIQNDLITLFSSKTFEEVNTLTGREQLRSESLILIQSILKKEVGDPGIEAVLFTSFILQ